MTRPSTISIFAKAFLLGGLLLFSSCKKKSDPGVIVPVFPDRPEVRFESFDENGNPINGSRRTSGSGDTNTSSATANGRDETGSLPEFHQVPKEAESAAEIPELAPITFDLNSEELTDAQKLILQRHLDYLKDHDGLFVVLRGHTDEQGTNEYNYSLGQRRATSVRDFLVQNAVQPERLSTLSYGEDYPLIDGENSESYAQNRRVDFLIYEVEN